VNSSNFPSTFAAKKILWPDVDIELMTILTGLLPFCLNLVWTILRQVILLMNHAKKNERFAISTGGE